MKSSIFWNIPPCNLSKCSRFFGLLGSKNKPSKKAVCESRWKAETNMEATCSSETSVDLQRTTRRYVPED
jgi:hypothetical protein